MSESAHQTTIQQTIKNL